MAAGSTLLVILVLTSVNVMPAIAAPPNSARHGKNDNDFVLHILLKQDSSSSFEENAVRKISIEVWI